MASFSNKPAPGLAVLIRLDDKTNKKLLKARERSGRSKTLEALLRLQDHLSRFPDFYNSDNSEGLPAKK
ncbi:TraY domain-containing protein [Hafnia alvei]|uniref:TraY domain-containing protein n=1 Tax=Hafnia alvei TaxID=569 RepID=UPI002DB851E5|nr:TraY domain-containing protein [Hafnia alvei]MEB7891764.1 TraY domain-containing protein [Hafnia alvei]